jgi:CRISPR-associated protein Cas2
MGDWFTLEENMRRLFVIAYDISEPRRLQRVQQMLKGYSTGGQKSVYECFLTEAELRSVLRRLQELINMAEDRVHVFVLDGRTTPHTLGIAVKPWNPSYFYVG